MLEKIINNKIVWFILGGMIIVLLAFLVLPINNNLSDNKYKETDKKIIFELIGDSSINLYVGSSYDELGVVALLDDETDLSNNIKIQNNINITKVGIYEVTYTLSYKGIEKKLVRKVIVEDLHIDDIKLELNGSDRIYLNFDETYDELGAIASYNGMDLTNNITITNNIKKEVGIFQVIYKVKYQNLEKQIIRQVNVFDIDKMFIVDKENLTIQITLDDNFIYVKLPNGVISKEKNVIYNISGNGNYLFYVYTNDYKKYEKIINVEPISETPITTSNQPIGTCQAILKDGKTTVTVKSDSVISKYTYNGVVSKSSVYTVNKYLREVSVVLTGENNLKTNIKCNVKLESLPVNKPSGNIKYALESDTLKIYVIKKDGFYLSYIWTRDAVNQFKKQLTTSTSKKPIDILAIAVKNNNLKNKIMLGFNTCAPVDNVYWTDLGLRYPEYYLKEPLPLLIYNGQIIINDYERYPVGDLPIYYIDGSNQLKYARVYNMSVSERKKVFDDIVSSGTQNTFGFNSELVNNGVALDISKYTDADKISVKARRQALCQVNSNNFILATSINGESAGIVTRQYLANYLANLGCETAVNLDGGGSSATLIKESGTENIQTITGGGRELTTAMYFTELN